MKTKPETTIEKVIARLDCIAHVNNDDFLYRIDILTSKRGKEYRFVCIETGDSHELFDGIGESIEDAVNDCNSSINSQCEEIGYKSVE